MAPFSGGIQIHCANISISLRYRSRGIWGAIAPQTFEIFNVNNMGEREKWPSDKHLHDSCRCLVFNGSVGTRESPHGPLEFMDKLKHTLTLLNLALGANSEHPNFLSSFNCINC